MVKQIPKGSLPKKTLHKYKTPLAPVFNPQAVATLSRHLLLLTAEILHHLPSMKPYKKWDILHINWFAGFHPSRAGKDDRQLQPFAAFDSSPFAPVQVSETPAKERSSSDVPHASFYRTKASTEYRRRIGTEILTPLSADSTGLMLEKKSTSSEYPPQGGPIPVINWIVSPVSRVK